MRVNFNYINKRGQKVKGSTDVPEEILESINKSLDTQKVRLKNGAAVSLNDMKGPYELDPFGITLAQIAWLHQNKEVYIFDLKDANTLNMMVGPKGEAPEMQVR